MLIHKHTLFPQHAVMSVSAKKPTGSTIESFLPVSLDPKVEADFLRHFHAKLKPLQAPKLYVEFANYMAELSSYIEAIYAGLREGLYHQQAWSDQGKDVGAEVSKTIDHYYKTAVEKEATVKRYIQAMSFGGNHIIKSSQRFKSGMDVMFVGQRGANKSSILSVEIANPPSVLPSSTSTYFHKELEIKQYQHPLGKAFIDTGWLLQKAMFKDENISTLKGAYSRIVEQHLIPDATRLVAQFIKVFTTGPLAKAGIAVQLPPFEKVLSPGALTFLEKYNSMIVVREPNNVIVNNRVRKTEVPDESLEISMEYQALQPSIAFSFALNLPIEFVEYIVQSKEKVSLASLNVWASVWSSAMMKPPGMKGTGLYPSKVPHYVLMPSMSSSLSKKREELGLYTEPGRSNKDGLYITERGNLSYLPKQDEASEENAKAYEKVLEDCLAISYEAGAPLITSQEGSAGSIFDLAHPEYADKIRLLKGQLHKFKGCLQTYNWDLNCIITTSVVSPDRFVSQKLVGCSKPDELNISTYMRSTFMKGMCEMFSDSTIAAGPKRIAPEPEHFADISTAIESSSLFVNLGQAYNMLEKRKLVPDLGELIKRSAEALKVKDLRDEQIAVFEIDRFDSKKSIYGKYLTPELQFNLVADNDPKTQELTANAGKTILHYLSVVANDARALGRSNLAAYCIKENADPTSTGRFFEPQTHTIHEFENLFQYFGGQIFLQAMKAINAVSSKDLMLIGEEVDPNSKESFVGFSKLQSEVIPFCVMFSKYITDLKEAIFKKAEELEENNKHPKVSEEELNIAGSRTPSGTKPGMQLFPHQAECLSILKNHPRIAVLDIAPGGGKTTLGIADIAMTYADGLIERPFVICPNGLVGNWAEDIHKHMEGRWNVIPVTTETYGLWGDERLTEMIKTAPKNTIIIVGNSFLGNRGKFQLILGNSVENVSDSLEFCKKFHPDYIFLDESHRMRNTGSGIHKYVKSLTQMSSLKFGRIGTGTFIQNVLSDAVGQTALFNAQVFRTKEEFDTNHKAMISSIGGEDVYDYTPDAPSRVRRRLGQFATVISYKRKEWAFMLPLPVETFISVKFEGDKDEKLNPEDEELGRQHRMFYDAVLKQTMEELKNDKILQKLIKGDDDDGDDDDDAGGDSKKSAGDDSRSVTTKEGTKIDVTDGDDDSDNLDALEAALQPYLQRLERILTDPLGDEDLAEAAKPFFGDATRDTFVTAKVRKVIQRIKKNFESNEWYKGVEVASSDILDYNGKSYIFKAEEPVGHTKTKSTTAPDEDTENWKPQAKGKVLVFCRFTRSVDAIYRALPADLKKQAVIFHGEVDGNKWENLESFKNDPKINILIANEMGISEGHNLQMASRFIRVESPWAPGELDQSASRIFRPDVTGKYQRQTIFLDWIICDGTLEVAKMGRLISKMLRKAQFDELDNPKYYKNLNPLNLPIIKMSLDNIKALNKMSDLCAIAGEGDTSEFHPLSYIGQYQYLVSEMGDEFREMKKTKRSQMIDVKPTPMPDDAKIIEFTPWVANMKVPDRHDEGLLSLKGVLQEEEHPLTVAFRKDRKALNGQFVRCEFGLGTIKRVSTTRSGSEEGTEGSGTNVSKVWVELAQGGNVESLSASKVYLATKITDKTKNALNKKAPKITKEDKERTAGNRKKADDAIERASRREKQFVKKVTESKPAGKKRVVEEQDEQMENLDITLYPVVYNDFLALEAVTDDPELSLKKLGFSKFGNYAWLPIKTYANFTKILDFLESKYTLAPKTARLLDQMHDSFASGRGRKFDVELAPVSQLPQFYRLRHTLTQITNRKKPELKLYPVILSGGLMLVVDIATNPVIRKMLGKAIPGTSPVVKFQEADGLEIEFFGTKRELITKVKDIKAAGYNIVNYAELKEEVGNLDLKQITGK